MRCWRGLAAALLALGLCGFAPEGNAFAAAAADGVLSRAVEPDMGEEERARAIYKYLVENVAFGDPVGLDVWRWRGRLGDAVPDYVENRSLSPMLFGLGSCEDYAAAMVLLCRRAGLEAQYVAGLTVSVEGQFVDHAWAAVRVDGRWYHADPQLERNVLHGGPLTWRYYLKNDAVLLADHRWGTNLAAFYGNPGGEAQRELLERWTPPACTAVFPAPEAEIVTPRPAPDRARLLAKLADERAAYEREHGPLPETELNVRPPQVILVR